MAAWVEANAKGDWEGIMEQVIELLRRTADAQKVELPPETESLFECGVLDSFGLLEFITALEEELNMTIPEDDLLPSNFETIAKIRTYIDGKLGR